MDLNDLFKLENSGISVFSGTVYGLFGRLFDKGKISEIINLYKTLKENFNDIKIRLDKFKSWLNTNDSSTIALVSHGTFLSQITGFFLENCEHFIWEY